MSEDYEKYRLGDFVEISGGIIILADDELEETVSHAEGSSSFQFQSFRPVNKLQGIIVGVDSSKNKRYYDVMVKTKDYENVFLNIHHNKLSLIHEEDEYNKTVSKLRDAINISLDNRDNELFKRLVKQYNRLIVESDMKETQIRKSMINGDFREE